MPMRLHCHADRNAKMALVLICDHPASTGITEAMDLDRRIVIRWYAFANNTRWVGYSYRPKLHVLLLRTSYLAQFSWGLRLPLTP